MEILSAFATESDTGGRTMKIQIRKILPESIAAVILIALSAYLLGGDVWTILDLVAPCTVYGNGCHASDGKTF